MPTRRIYPSVMIDIETLSSESNAAVIQIGACAFDIGGDVGEPFSILVKPDLLKTPASLSTVCWWMKQNESAREHVAKCDTEGKSPDFALIMLDDYISENCHPDVDVWAMPPEFDLVILRHLGNTVGRAMPWRFDRTRDLRTLEKLAGATKKDRAIATVAHDAGWDAHAQALTAIAYHKKVFGNAN